MVALAPLDKQRVRESRGPSFLCPPFALQSVRIIGLGYPEYLNKNSLQLGVQTLRSLRCIGPKSQRFVDERRGVVATNPAKRSWVAANEKEAEAAAREDRDPDAGVKSGLTMGSVRPATVFLVTTREKAQAALDRLPEDRMETALAALEAVEGRDTSIQAILARHGEQRLDPEEFERQFGSLPSPPGRWLGSCGHGEWAE